MHIDTMISEKTFNPDMLYSHIVHYYIDKKGCTKEEANKIAQKVIMREAQRRICKDSRCSHSSNNHVDSNGTCLILDCSCTKFLK